MLRYFTGESELLNAPYGFEAGDANLRRYVGNGVTNGVDPTGLDVISADNEEKMKGLAGIDTLDLRLFIESILLDYRKNALKDEQKKLDRNNSLLDGIEKDLKGKRADLKMATTDKAKANIQKEIDELAPLVDKYKDNVAALEKSVKSGIGNIADSEAASEALKSIRKSMAAGVKIRIMYITHSKEQGERI